MPRIICLLFCLAFLAPAWAQKPKGIEKQLDIFFKSKHLRAKKVANALDLRAGDTIADIGTANGWFAAVLSMYADSLTFYLEDIDSAIWNREAFDSAFSFFASASQKSPSHQFHYRVGSETSSGLPKHTFDKVLIIDTYHHFSNREAMMKDAISLLKPGGSIAILEALARRPGDYHQGCKKSIYSENEIIAHMTALGMSLQDVTFIHKVAGRNNKLFIFTQG